MKKLEKFISKKFFGKTSIEKKRLTENYFINHETGTIDQKKLIETTKQAISEDPDQKFAEHYYQNTDSSLKIINQLILNEMINKHLQFKSEKETKKAFARIIKRGKWIDLVKWDNSFVINKANLEQELQNLGILPFANQEKASLSVDYQNCNDNNESLLDKSYTSLENQTTINIELLEQAICAHVFAYQNLNINIRSANIISKQSHPGNSLYRKIRRFLKKGLEVISLNGKKEIGFGIHYEIVKNTNTLRFYGSVWDNFAKNVLVIQITDKRNKILREIWLYGVSDKAKKQDSFEHVEVIL